MDNDFHVVRYNELGRPAACLERDGKLITIDEFMRAQSFDVPVSQSFSGFLIWKELHDRFISDFFPSPVIAGMDIANGKDVSIETTIQAGKIVNVREIPPNE